MKHQAVIWLMALGISTVALAEINDNFKDDIALLKLEDRSGAPLIRFWDNHPVAASVGNKGGFRWWSFTANHLEPSMLTIPGIQEIQDLETVDGRAVAIGEDNGRIKLMEKVDGDWRSIPAPSDLQGARNVIVTSTDGLAILNNGRLFRLIAKKWSVTDLPVIPKFGHEFTPSGWGDCRIIYNSHLYVGWDRGEWGGMVNVLDLSNPKQGWKEVSGQKAVTGKGIIGNDPVTGMLVDSKRRLWISEGCCHMGGMWRGLFEYDGREWTTVVHGSFDKSEGGLASFPGERTDIAGIAIAPDQKLYVLAGELGIHTYEMQKLVPVVSIDFYSIGKPHFSKGKIDYECPCYPDNLVVDSDKNIFVSTSYFGILCFVRSGERYRLRQIMLPSTQSNP